MNLIQGNCLEKMKDISDNSIDLLFCDLPYGQTSCKWDSIIDLKLFWKEVNRICKIDCPMFFTCSTKFGVSLINSNPKNFRYDLVWVKSAPCGFLNAKKMPMKRHEMIYVFYRKLPMYNISSHKHKFLRERKEEWCDKNGLYGEDISVPKTEYKYDPPLPNSVIRNTSNYKNKRKHPTQKPTDLIKWCLKYYSNEGDTILDPTMGSGSTGVACKEMNRNFIGIEKDEKIFNVAVERINEIN